MALHGICTNKLQRLSNLTGQIPSEHFSPDNLHLYEKLKD